MTTEEYPVPDNMVGLIIGRGGDQITKIQGQSFFCSLFQILFLIRFIDIIKKCNFSADTGCRVAVVPQPTGSITRPCTLTGTAEQISGLPFFLYAEN